MADEKGNGSETARKARAQAAEEGETNPRKSQAAEAEPGKRGGR